ncbi:N-formylglutamate amidohydrolase [Geopsychrobacter electrodiphilus]|uniref:N-formylglutamate amidohydrolase n=1 Tax=Geopsychrobacter electrodiphilus TaxID=225196 RepID=UPI00037A6803|nr:N-formylglutamate amidohydrolase [Geopsychrobacter electrodiphilus]
MAEPRWRLLLSCEHGGNLVPEPYQGLFAGQEALLKTHRGYDIGIEPFARRLAAELKAPLQLTLVSRLLIELNRSPGHPALFSEFTRNLNPAEREALLKQHYRPYRAAIMQQIEQLLASHCRVCHVSLHSFTPELHGELRNADIGLLYDPQRPLEKQFCLNWQKQIEKHKDSWRVRRNYPYRGAADGLITQLRRRFPAESYLGFELELNQCWPLQGGERWEALQVLIGETLLAAIKQ